MTTPSLKTLFATGKLGRVGMPGQTDPILHTVQRLADLTQDIPGIRLQVGTT
jgi:hypothetical protein